MPLGRGGFPPKGGTPYCGRCQKNRIPITKTYEIKIILYHDFMCNEFFSLGCSGTNECTGSIGSITFKALFLSKQITGDRVTVLASRRSWVKVSMTDKLGWIHQSALTEKKVIIKSGSQDLDSIASDEEIAFARKGLIRV